MGKKKTRTVKAPVSSVLMELVQAEIEMEGRSGALGLAERIGIAQPMLTRWLTGQRTLKLPTVDKIAAYFGAELAVKEGKK